MKYKKETNSTLFPVRCANYDEIDDEIPSEVSKQALRTIQSCKSVKSEIFRQNKEIAARMARSAIGAMMRRYCATSTSAEPLVDDCNIDNVIVRSSSNQTKPRDSLTKTSEIASCLMNPKGKGKLEITK